MDGSACSAEGEGRTLDQIWTKYHLQETVSSYPCQKIEGRWAEMGRLLMHGMAALLEPSSIAIWAPMSLIRVFVNSVCDIQWYRSRDRSPWSSIGVAMKPESFWEMHLVLPVSRRVLIAPRRAVKQIAKNNSLDWLASEVIRQQMVIGLLSLSAPSKEYGLEYKVNGVKHAGSVQAHCTGWTIGRRALKWPTMHEPCSIMKP